MRRRDNITGLGSGIKVAAKVFPPPQIHLQPFTDPTQGLIYNLFDGFTGLAYQPYHEARKDGVPGFGKGLGKGFGGLVFKTTAAFIGVPAYSMKGLEKQFEKRRDRGLKAKILQVRLKQSLTDHTRASKEEKDAIIARWKELGCVKKFGAKV